ncbi:hypothetical protein FBU59_001093 [Linderina macrospora]|uniref:Uncharacterized protein n=1 Tax=Linderina macrospora TaxID=4868 RepID=A0ACC1JFA4_9FUNG|nr:hypothetical protein FBU59_001093 [Linderina macrospora]
MSVVLRTHVGELPLPVGMDNPTPREVKQLALSQQQSLRDTAIGLFELDKCKRTMVGDSTSKGISGGERKRTAIAMEYVTDTQILFLDEPTSGLDAHSALAVTHQLKRIANNGKTVVAVLHQPSSEMFGLIDDLLVLTEGQIAYFGERSGFIQYVDNLGFPCGMYINPADHLFNSVLFPVYTPEVQDRPALETSESRSKILVSAWSKSHEAATIKAFVDRPELSAISRSQLRRTSPMSVQLKYLIQRVAKNARRNPIVVYIRTAQSTILGLILGLLFLNTDKRPASVQMQNFSGAMFLSCAAQYMLTLLAVVNAFAGERPVFIREWQAGYYSLSAYFLAKNIVELPIQIYSPALYAVCAYWLIGFQQTAAKFFLFMVTCIALSMCGFSFGIMLGSAFSSLSVILAILPAVIIPFLLFGGLFVNSGNSTVWLRWIQWLSPIKYGYAALSKNQFTGYVVDGMPVGDTYLDNLQLGSFSVGVNILFVFILAIVLWCASFAALWRLTARGRGRFNQQSRNQLVADLLGPPDERFISPTASDRAE